MMSWQLQLFYDGSCPLCSREINWLKARTGESSVLYTDIADRKFCASGLGLAQDELMGQIHALLPDGTVVCGMEVFRRVYRIAGLGWILAPTGWPVIRPVFDRLYLWFARNRLWITGKTNSSCEC